MKHIQYGMIQSPNEHLNIKFGSRDFVISIKLLFIAIMVVATILRLFSAVYQGNSVSDLPGIYDQISYDGLARRVVDGYGFSFAEGHWPATRAEEPTAHWSYLYTIYLAAIYKLFGTYPVIARIIQALVAGIFQTILLWRIGNRLFNQTVGLIAAGLNAIYIYFFYYAGALITETFYITCILWIFDIAFRILHTDQKPSGGGAVIWLQWLELGLAIGLTVLLRQLFLLFLPFLFIWLWWNIRDEHVSENQGKGLWNLHIHWTALKGLSIVVLVLSVMITPWTMRNYRAFGTFVLLNTNAGFAFYWGNHPIYGTKFISLLNESYYDLIPPELLPLNEGMLDRALLQEGIKIVINDPARYILLSISRIDEYFKFWPSPNSSMISNISRVGSFGILLPFMAIGLWLSLSFFRNPTFYRQRSYLFILYLFIVIYTGIHLLSWTLIRYRLPIDAILIIFSALTFTTLVKQPNRILMVD